MATDSIIIVGGGIAGLSVTYELTKLKPKQKLILVEAGKVGQGCSNKAAGLLTPATEVHLKDEAFLKTVLTSCEHYHSFAREITHNNVSKIDFQNQGSLLCAFENDGERDLNRLVDFKQTLGMKVVELNTAELKTKEPFLSHKITKAYYAPEEGCVDPILLMKLLQQEIKASGCEILENTHVQDVTFQSENITSITLSNGETLPCAKLILTSGLNHNITSLKTAFPLPLRPVKGEALLLKLPKQILNHPLQIFHRYPIYMAPRRSGEIVVGATSEEKSDTDTTAGAVLDLLFSAWQVLPEIYEHQLVKTWAGLRPTTPDNYPVVGNTNINNLYCLLGLYRKGIMLAPYLAKELAQKICDKDTQLQWDLFRYDRF